jgi:two-component system chemotaxis sensor kinase CheA
MMFDFNLLCLVGEFTKIMPDGKTKIMEMDWDPISGDSGNVDKLMVTLRDVTALRGLQAEAEKQKWELDVIGQILSVSSDKFLSFIRDADRFVDENEKLITQNNKPVSDVIATLFRNMHTIKGNARIYSFTAITDVAHAAEDTYNEMRKNDATAWDKVKMIGELDATRSMLKIYENIFTAKLAGNTTPGLFVEQELLDKFMLILDGVNEKDVASLQKGFKAIKNITAAIGTESILSILDAIINSLPEMAHKLGKAAPKVMITDHDLRFLPEFAPVIKNVLTHSFRNAMDHGLETGDERKAHGKPDFGTINVDLHQKGDQIVLQISDDGRGLPVNKLKQKAIKNGTLKADGELTAHELSELIFQSGLSTADNVSDISGRGVGMDAIRKFIENAGGKVGIQFKHKPEKNSEYLPFILNITLPSSCAKQVA